MPETDFKPIKSFTGYKSSLAFGSVTSFFGIKVRRFYVFLVNDKMDLRQISLQGLGQTLVHYILH